MIPDDGANRIRDLVDSDLNEGQVGTGDTAPLLTDTALENATSGTNKSLTTTKTDRQISVSYTLPSTDGNGNTFSEYGIDFNSGNTLLNRVIYNSISKTANESLTHITRFFFRT